MAHAVDQARMVTDLPAQDAPDVGSHFFVIGPVADVGLDLLKLPQDLTVGAAVLRALEGADRRRDGGIGIGARGGNAAAGEGGVVAAAVFRVADQAQVQHPRLLLGIALVRTDHAEEILRRREGRLRTVEVETVIFKIMALDHIGIGRHDGKPRHQFDGLAHHILHAQIVGRGVIGIQGQHRAAQLVHDVATGILQDGVLGEILRQRRAVIQKRAEHLILLPVG